MTDRERLIELLNNFAYDISLCDICERADKDCFACENERLADYLIEHGVIVPPCKSGDTVYFIYEDMILEGTVRNIGYVLAYVSSKRAGFAIQKCAFDESAFLTREEAEKALKERENK